MIRTVSWKAIHDYGQKGFNSKLLIDLVNKFKKKGRILISSEAGDVLEELRPYILEIQPEMLHSVLYYADLFVGDGQIVSVEAGVLGTPSIRFNTLVGSEHDCGKFNELHSRGIVYSLSNRESFLKKVDEILNNKKAKLEAKERSKKFLCQVDDVTLFFLNLIENEVWESL